MRVPHVAATVLFLMLLLGLVPGARADHLRPEPPQQIAAILADRIGNTLFGVEPFMKGVSGGSILFYSDAAGSGQRLDERGVPIGPEFALGEPIEDAAVQPDGSGLAVFSVEVGIGFPVDYEIYGLRFDASGAPIGSPFRVPDPSGEYERDPVAAPLADGAFLVVWRDGRVDQSVFARRVEADGSLVLPEFRLDAPTLPDTEIRYPSIAELAAGSFVVSWGVREFGETGEMRARLLDSTGTPVGLEFVVNSTAGPPFSFEAPATVVALADGGFAIAWATYADPSILAQRFDATGSSVGTEIDVSSSFVAPRSLSMAPVSDGFVIAFEGYSTVGDQETRWVRTREFDAAGQPIGAEFGVNLTRDSTYGGAVQPIEEGGYVVVWSERRYSEHGALGQKNAVFAQRFCSASDTGCVSCPWVADPTDSDGDGVPDGCDLCTNVGGARDFHARFRLSIRDQADGSVKPTRMMVRGEFTLDVPFSSLALDTTGAYLRVQAETMDYIVDQQIAPGQLPTGFAGAGWQGAGSGKKWTWRSRAEPADTNGLLRLVVKDRTSLTAPGRTALKLVAKGGQWNMTAGDVPIAATVRLGEQASGASGPCAESSLGPEDCYFVDVPPRIECNDR